MGKSARAMLEALLAGQTNPAALANLARGRLKAKRAELELALTGVLKPHHRFFLREQLTHIDTLDEAITQVSQEIEVRMAPEETAEQEPLAVEPEQVDKKQPLTWAMAVTLLSTIPGIGQRAAEGILAEIGLDMSRFPSANHLSSWAGMSPGNHQSAGKRLSGKTSKGSPWLRLLLVEAAHAAAHTKNTYLSAQYRRLAARRGKKKAMIAVGHSILVIIYHLLDQQVGYEELGSNYFDERDRQATEKQLVRRLEKLGYQVSLQPAEQAA
jgi:transposase